MDACCGFNVLFVVVVVAIGLSVAMPHCPYCRTRIKRSWARFCPRCGGRLWR